MACLDEAGRGPLAGPVTAAAVFILNTKYHIPYTVYEIQNSFPQNKENIFINLLKKSKYRMGDWCSFGKGD